jgi:hypothetical protein
MFYKKGQSVSGEYVLLAVLVVLAITAMTVYVRRTLQGRMRDASMVAVLRANTALGQDVLIEYEPYYTDTAADTAAASVKTQRVVANSQIAQTSNTERRTHSQSVQLPFAAYTASQAQ